MLDAFLEMLGDLLGEPILKLVLMPISKAMVKLWDAFRGLFQ
jgi:hypothetical protein